MALGLGCDMFLSNGDVSSFHFGTSPSLEFSQDLYPSSLDEKTYVILDADVDTGGFLLSPQEPSTPSSRNSSSLSPVSPSFGMQTESLDRPSKASSTFLLDSRSLLPGHSLLSDTASFLALKGFGSPMTSEPLQSPSPPPEPEPTPRGPRPSLESRSSATNRGVTVQRLALDLTLSPSGSLSALIHALEDAAPGWYQSLMESATPQELYDSSWAVLGSSPTLVAKPSSCIAHEGSPGCGLPEDMLASLDALESIAAQVRVLPLPRPQTAFFEDVRTIFLKPDDCAKASLSKCRPSMLVSPPLTPPKQGRELSPASEHTPVQPHLRDEHFGLGEETPRAPSTPPKRPAYYSAPPSRIAVSNIANHPKLTRTLGLSSLTPSRLPTPRGVPLPRPEDLPLPPSVAVPPVISKKSSMKSLKAPKTPKALKSIFRSRPSAPPPHPSAAAPRDDDADDDYDYDGCAESPVRKPPPKYRFSEAGLRREDRRIDSVRRHFSSGANAPPLPRALPSRRQTADAGAGSFLLM